jgi:uncharacterized protein YndB with AHSA1/START domain
MQSRGAQKVLDQLWQLRAAREGLTISRAFDAPRQLVWKEWTEPWRFADWFGGPGVEVPLSSVSIDLVPGGAWAATTLSFPERRDTRWEGEYVEVVEPERLAFTIRGFPGAPTPDLVTVILSEAGDSRTEMRFRQQGQRTAKQYERARGYWSAEFDLMAERLID